MFIPKTILIAIYFALEAMAFLVTLIVKYAYRNKLEEYQAQMKLPKVWLTVLRALIVSAILFL